MCATETKYIFLLVHTIRIHQIILKINPKYVYMHIRCSHIYTHINVFMCINFLYNGWPPHKYIHIKWRKSYYPNCFISFCRFTINDNHLTHHKKLYKVNFHWDWTRVYLHKDAMKRDASCTKRCAMAHCSDAILYVLCYIWARALKHTYNSSNFLSFLYVHCISIGI